MMHKNNLPGYLSRVLKEDCIKIKIKYTIFQGEIIWANEHDKDLEIRSIKKLINTNNYAEKTWCTYPVSRRWWHESKQLYVDEGILKHSNNLKACPRDLL